MLDQEVYLEQCVGIRRAGGRACVGASGAFLTINDLSAPINGGLKKTEEAPLLNLNFNTYFGVVKVHDIRSDFFLKPVEVMKLLTVCLT
jgi:hypothetical protein